MPVNLRQALRLAVGPANVDAAGHAVADWFDGHNCSGAADLIREHLQDQQGGDAVPHNRPDTSLRSELMAKLATQREVILSLCDRVDRLEMRADGLMPWQMVERRWAKEAAGDDKLDRLIAQDRADEPAVPEGREPASVVGELIKRLRIRAASLSEVGANLSQQGDAIYFTRAADLLEQRHPAPVSVTERLPGPEDCDAEGMCWRWNTIAGVWSRQHYARHWYEFETHWLHATALPLPSSTSPNKAND